MIEALLLGVAALAVVAWAARHKWKLDRTLRLAADSLELRVERRGGLRLVGHVDGTAVEVRLRRRIARAATGDTLEVRARAELPPGVRLRRESAPGALWRSATGDSDVTVGDETFDGLALIRGHEPFVLATLDARVRRLLTEAFERHDVVALEDDHAVLADARRPSDPAGVVALVREVVALATAVTDQPGGIPQRLAAHAARDPQPGVRLRNLSVLADFEAGSSLAIQALQRGLSDDDAAVRLTAATELGADGIDGLVALARDASVADALRLGAVARLDGRGAVADVAGLGSVVADQGAVALAIARLLSHRGLAPPGDWLDHVATSEHAEAQEAFADIVGSLGIQGHEPRLLELLGAQAATVQAAAGRALGAVGSLAAVERLLESTRGVMRSEEVKSAAREAIQSIQSRAGTGERGGLSVADGLELGGSLTLHEGGTGHLAVADDHAER